MISLIGLIHAKSISHDHAVIIRANKDDRIPTFDKCFQFIGGIFLFTRDEQVGTSLCMNVMNRNPLRLNTL